jgi:hypothetical protein
MKLNPVFWIASLVWYVTVIPAIAVWAVGELIYERVKEKNNGD